MILEYFSLLQIQRDLYDLPRGPARFKNYIETLRGQTKDDMELPLSALNPMGHDHIPTMLDQYIELKADEEAAIAAAETLQTHRHIPGEFKVTLVIADDARGQWTNRFATEYGHMFETKPYHSRGWISGMLWTSEEPDIEKVREEIKISIFRAAHITAFGHPITLRQMLAQEGYARFLAAGSILPAEGLDQEEIEYTRQLISPHLDSDVYPICVSCIFGDPAAHQLGYKPLGLSANAGLALAVGEYAKN